VKSLKFSNLGPGLLLAATGIGVGDMVSSTIAGAEYGLTLLWALAAGVVVKFAITEGAARWQLATGTSLMEGWRDHLPRMAVAAFAVYFVVWSYMVSSALVTASAMVPAAIIPAVPLWVFGILHAVAAFVMVYYGRYERFLAIIKWFVGLKFGAVMGSVALIVLWSGADPAHFGARIAPSASYTLSLIGGVGGTVTLLSCACCSPIASGRRSAVSDGACSCSGSGAPRSPPCSACSTACPFSSTTCCTCGGARRRPGSRARRTGRGPAT
jgi:Mn2+/Fe2+ NRAMP family transporter